MASLKLLSNTLRILSADIVENAKSGHPGLPLGFSDVFTVLVSKFLKYNPKDPKWSARDRLVLSAGHGSALLYSFLYLSGYEGYTLKEIKNFRQVGSITPGHPEFNQELGIETTTGPLGQGFANSVGIAIAQKKYEQKLGKNFSYKIYCIAGDGCLMEGITHEAASLAGHLGLNNLIVLFDDNHISIDGPTSLATSDDHIAKFKALGWEIFSADGHDFESIEDAFNKAQNQYKPCLIAFRTKIGFGSGTKENSEESHGAPLGKNSIEQLRKNFAWDYPPFEIPEELSKLWQEAWKYNEEHYKSWNEDFKKLSSDKREYLAAPDRNKLQEIIASFNHLPNSQEATRVSCGKIIEIIIRENDKIILGSADLSVSNGLYNSYCKPITKNDFSGNFIHYGVRENAMGAIMNGLATQNFLPIGGTFLVFSDYMRPSIRLSAIMNLPCIYITTHDSIGVGEDGPTHQPVEHLASLRAMPNLSVYRPCDMVEVEASINLALSNENSPSLLALTRQKLEQREFSILRKENCSKGAYILKASPVLSHAEVYNFLKDNKTEIIYDASIWATGSEVEIAMKASDMLESAGFTSIVISAPNLKLFFQQDKNYVDSLLNKDGKLAKLNCAIEAAISFGWGDVIGRDGLFFGMNSFGESGKAEDLYSYFNLTPARIVDKIIDKLRY